MKKTYAVTHDQLEWALTVEINHTLADPRIKAMVEFWSDWELRIEECDGDYTQAFLKQLAREALMIVIGGRFLGNRCRVIQDEMQSREGYNMEGITITAAEATPLNDFDFTVETVGK